MDSHPFFSAIVVHKDCPSGSMFVLSDTKSEKGEPITQVARISRRKKHTPHETDWEYMYCLMTVRSEEILREIIETLDPKELDQ